MPTNIAAFDAALRAVAGELGKLDGLADKVTEIAAPKIREQVDDEFAQGAGPSGESWAPLKSGGPAHLEKTGKMRRKLKVTAEGAFVVGKIYAPANIHQYGARVVRGGKVVGHIPARPMFPKKGEIPPKWEKTIEESAVEAFDAMTARAKEIAGK